MYFFIRNQNIIAYKHDDNIMKSMEHADFVIRVDDKGDDYIAMIKNRATAATYVLSFERALLYIEAYYENKYTYTVFLQAHTASEISEHLLKDT